MASEHSVLVDDFKSRFFEIFAKSAEFVVRCPGRVNLIGEHIDYNGYGVLPMAIEQSIYVVFARNDSNIIRFRNSAEKFVSFDWTIDETWPGAKIPKWYEYFLSGWKGAIDWLSSNNKQHSVSGIDLYIHGDIPPAAGLSSSSAMVCAAVLSTWTLYTSKIFDGYDKRDVVEVATESERLVGLEGGGMDQAAVVLADEGTALHIDFDPLVIRKVELPLDALFCVLHSGVDSNKAASSYYNERVVECRVAAQLLTLASKPSFEDYRKIRRLRDYQTETKFSLEKCSQEAKVQLHEGNYSREELLQILDTTDSDFRKNSLNLATVTKTEFQPLKRAVHVFDEAKRVDDFENACLEKDLIQMGALMNKSHFSCKDLYECSCPEMDELTEKCRESGCKGARLTGAGWGGCAVALVDKRDRDKVEAKVNVLFWTKPSAGIQVFRA
ncbi:unnamed protein product [Bursaphelenchus xylophilus]|uniref:(pine wood nematode) hypothetical protein n=1 Tax=Bursaphelenchus xylophilus TaxID=6326 RepID=A0A1I7S8T1_BURXY|nr:unnamed protein product [Bursaphelenchus xylophilus]CAG9085819.1 unnamed protein product [Bursaphelenchus xylophilus]